jgi:hypothetical protein
METEKRYERRVESPLFLMVFFAVMGFNCRLRTSIHVNTV